MTQNLNTYQGAYDRAKKLQRGWQVIKTSLFLVASFGP